ncbi:MAG: hypothetical protein KME08_09770 [Aphanothece sp. CMT-3BRIN-NPC111]|jgi:hypothetical protein|nr:hypothetical protein [Aphanothece sp. CMT-3BRIN-NPC111]
MEPVSLTAGAIATLALTKVFETSIEKFTEAALGKIDQLRQKIWDKFKSNDKAEKALAAAEQRSKPDLDKVSDYLKVMMNEDPDFAKEVQALAREIEAGKIENSQPMTQIIKDQGTGYQLGKAEGTNYIGGTHTHNHQT